MAQLPRPATRFDIYDRMTPPWDIGRPQPAIVELADADVLRGRVLDIGCGTGEHALMASARGFEATGLDSAPTAITIARRKAAERVLEVRFIVADALRLADLEERFDTVIDCGLFHTFSDDERRTYASTLRASVPAGGRLHILCFSDREPGTEGPRRIAQDDIRSTFAEGWQVDAIDDARMVTTWGEPSVLAWRASLTRR